MSDCPYLLGEGQKEGLILHSLQVHVGVRVQHLQALEELIIQTLNETHQVTPDLRTQSPHMDSISVCTGSWM